MSYIDTDKGGLPNYTDDRMFMGPTQGWTNKPNRLERTIVSGTSDSVRLWDAVIYLNLTVPAAFTLQLPPVKTWLTSVGGQIPVLVKFLNDNGGNGLTILPASPDTVDNASSMLFVPVVGVTPYTAVLIRPRSDLKGWTLVYLANPGNLYALATAAAASAASAAASAAIAAANNIFSSTAAGLSGTISGQYFFVPTTDLVGFSLYLNSSGSAVFQLAYPSLSGLKQNINGAGSADAWHSLVLNHGGTVSAATLSAVQQLEEWLRNFGLMEKLIYFNPRAGDTLSAARTPLVDRFGFSFDNCSPAFTTWSEGNGLTGGVLDTGINPTYTGITRYGMSMGVYSLTNSIDQNRYIVGSGGQSASSFYGLVPRFVDLLLFDWYGGNPGRVQGSVIVTDGSGASTSPTKGLLAGTRDPSGISRVYRNGVVLATSTTLPVDNFGGTLPEVAATIEIDTTNVASGGDFVGLAMDADDIAAMTWSLHQFNKNIGTPRAVIADGLF